MKKKLFRTLIAALLLAALAVPMFACRKSGPDKDTEANADAGTKAEQPAPETDPDPEANADKPLPTKVSLPASYAKADLEYVCDDGSVLYTFENKTRADYDAVYSYYKNENFSVYSSLEQAGNPATTFVGQSVMAHVYFTAYKGELNIVLSDKAADTLPPATPEVTNGGVECTITQIQDTQNFIGMGYVIQLRDGSFIVYDGSYANQASKIIGTIRKLHRGEGKPIVRAWLLTHSHNDHYPAFELIANKLTYRNQLDVEHVIVSPLNDANFSLNQDEEFYLSTKLYDDAALLGAKVVFAHTGMNFTFCNLNMEILYAPESTYKYSTDKGNFNSTSIVSRLYDESYSALFTGDVSTWGVDFLLNAYSANRYLKSNACQVSHHGVEGSYILELYDQVQAPLLFYPASYNLYDSMDAAYSPEVHLALEKREYVKEILIHGVGQYTRAWGTTYNPDAPISIPDYVPYARDQIGKEEVEIPDGVPYLSVSKTSFAQGEPILVTAYGAGFDWVGITRKGETDALRWWYLAPVGGSLNAWSGQTFDAVRLPANGESADPLTPGEYTLVLLKNNQTIAAGEFVAKMDITVTTDTHESATPSSDPVIHVNFDGKAEDSCGNATVTATGNVAYTEGYRGQGAIVGKNYLSIPGYTPGSDSFTIAVWAKVTQITGDPALFATKNWDSGANAGFSLGINSTSNLHANIGDGEGHRVDLKPSLTEDILNTWVHYTLVVDRAARQMKVSINFGKFETVTIPAELVNAPYEGLGALAIGQDATGNYGHGSMTCVVDEFMVFEKALSQAEVTALGEMFDS